jgi:hypothetical protein
MIVKYYQCNLCRDNFDPNEEDVVFGLEWKHDGLHITKTVAQIVQLEHHICIKCFQAIRAVDFPT